MTCVRKRHIGNDAVVIIFLDSDADNFDPRVLVSEFNRNVTEIMVVYFFRHLCVDFSCYKKFADVLQVGKY
jgi:hypothetical protein